ncbi:N-acetyltransferase family protein [Streptomyces sp. NPDC004690]
MEGLTIRPFEDADLPGAASALVEVHATDGYPVEGVENPENWLRSADVIAAWIAQSEKGVVGHVAVMKPHGEEAVRMWVSQSGEDERNIAVLARLFVVKDARGRATGEKLMKAAMEYAQRSNLRLVLDVMVKDRAAMRLYERLGWSRIGDAKHRYGNGQEIDAVCYVAPAG